MESVKIVLKLRIKSRTYINSAVFIHFVTRETVTEKTQCIVQFDSLKEMTSSLSRSSARIFEIFVDISVLITLLKTLRRHQKQPFVRGIISMDITFIS